MKAIKVFEFCVDGVAQSRGSKKPITVPGRRRGLLIDDNPESKGWMDVIRFYAKRAMREAGITQPFDGPLCLKVLILRSRPKSHYRTNGSVKASAPAFPHTKPDASKYLRAIEDALSKVLYVDDGRLVDSWPSKRFGKPGIVVQLFRLPATRAELGD